MFLIDQKGARVRPVCRECMAFHKPENCPRVKARKRRERQKDARFWAKCIALRDAIVAEHEARQA